MSVPADAVAAEMRKIPVDYFGHAGSIRPNGRVLYPITLYQVKSPEESKAAWDYYKPVGDVDADHAFRPMNEGGCYLIK
ncbi:hypothetical protein [Bradyrhizobium sp. NP1]|uniref:hypothetical protein n=1 Tax=Bradyrhizobium sp. NP1 TaxID=3049772 RepID=UPI0025A624B6|nr:hypothetical protein [Bradyrhizobium sp. NP1]WJR76833.1 hypothetical protein QOU61_29385 [Bradyrhizobium sp. NP1]